MTRAIVEHFRQLHRPGDPLVLANVWDIGSARILQGMGAKAIGTTSGGVAWAMGLADGGHLDQKAQLRLSKQLAACIEIPVTMDIENGYTNDAAHVGDFLVQLAGQGIAGVNIEDSHHGQVRSASEFAEWLSVVKSRLESERSELFLNVRADSYLLATGEHEQHVVRRLCRYADAGADGLFIPGLSELATIARLSDKVPAPVNVMAGSGSPSVAEFASVGVARISTGTWLAQAAYGRAMALAGEVLTAGNFTETSALADYGEMNAKMP